MELTTFQKDGFTTLKGVFSKEMCDLLAHYVLFRSKTNPNIRKGSDPLAGVHREYADPMMEFLLASLKPKIEEITGLELWPTLSFCYTYSKGTKLVPHKDRQSCEIVVSICLGCDEAFYNNNQTWPLFLESDGKTIPMSLDYGDILIFKGSETTHWREPFEGTWFVSAILAYVDKNGTQAYQKYDQRSGLGRPHIGMFNWIFGVALANIKAKCAYFANQKMQISRLVRAFRS